MPWDNRDKNLKGWVIYNEAAVEAARLLSTVFHDLASSLV